jgi:hypothetical protein
MTSEDNKARPDRIPEPGLSDLKARWEVPIEGPDEPKRKLLIDLAFRIAAIVQPDFAPSRTRLSISNTYSNCG